MSYPRVRGGLAVIAVLATAGCNYGFRSGSFPDHIRTVAILPFDNDTNRFELTQEIHEELLRTLPRGESQLRSWGIRVSLPTSFANKA